MSVLDGPGEGTWSVFAAKVVEERDALRERLAEIAEAVSTLDGSLDSYFSQHGPSCDEHPGGDSDPACELCAIDNDLSNVLRRVLYLCGKG